MSAIDLYAVLGVARDASTEESRTAWKRAVADLDPTDPKLNVFNQAGAVLLDEKRRAAYDAETAVENSAEAGVVTGTRKPLRRGKVVATLALGTRLAQRRTEETAGWWVFIPPQGSRQGALRKANELKGLGVDEYYIMPDEGEHRWALSLGVFRSEEAAQARLAALRAQGVRSARVGPRDTVVPKVWLQVKSVDAPLQARLKEMARQLEGTELRDCP